MFRSAILFISLSNWNFRVDELVSRGNSSVKFPSSTFASIPSKLIRFSLHFLPPFIAVSELNEFLFTRILFDAFMTDITLDFTTPFKFTSALPFFLELMNVMAAATAQEITTIEPVRGKIAWAINRSQWANAQISFTILWRWIQMYQF